MKKNTGILLKTVLPLALGVYLIWYFFTSMDQTVQNAFYKAVGEANYGWVILSLLLSVVSLFSRAYRWKYLLEPLGYKTSFWNRYHALMIGYIVNLTIPRAGEASRAVMLFRSDGVPFSKSFGTILAERVFDLVMLFGVTVLTIFLGSSDFWKLKKTIELNYGKTDQSGGFGFKLVLIGAGVIILGAVLLWLLPKVRNKLFGFVKGIFQGVFAVFKTKSPFAFLAHTGLIWFLYVFYFMLCFFALPETNHVPFHGMLIAFIAGSLGISLTNGGLGVFPLVVGLVVEYYLIAEFGAQAKGIGYALGMIIWSSQTLLMILLGSLSFLLLPKNFTEDVSRSENNQ